MGENEGRVAALLLDRGADVNAKNNELYTPLHRAAQCGHRMVVQMLLDRGADVRAKSRSGETAEDLASARGQAHVAALLWATAKRRAECEALAMGQHERLGAGSLLLGIESGLLQMILDQA